ncbi:SDR family oxidoreductase [Achromobacter anxifer]|uniref:Peroxisomal trans-2-enoyl-CoA reductase n=1 Tax=Achromobacter anxifer TaxID=1287737 RepID=A0A6S7F2Z3_9BURK|nr:SDR family oxidoreductase [Achromobacter anxifer]MDF8364973.1 SDR family oxidoreductase [Achromobacter anxifer]CAB3927518.1 putative 2,4-dienoyl-CoA reductase [Achromobacter anxifer]CAB5516776.1 putative 2,4-dienoyl-CoA reductase [Achromobacter anxifer]
MNQHPGGAAAGQRYASVFRPGLYEGKTIVVTGGGSGLGRCTAHELASLGASLALVGRKPDKLQAAHDEILRIYPEAAGRISLHVCDIRDEAGVRATVAEALARHGAIDGLFNCAGGQFPAPLDRISYNGWNAVVQNNLHGTFLVSREVYTQHMRQHGGAIVNMLADIWGGMPGMGHSGAARAGVWNLTETAACEWAHAGVRVNAVAPGWIASSGMDSYDEDYRAVLRELKTKVPLQRFGTEAELAAAVVFLLSPAAAFINGSVIRVDGGVPNARHSWTLAPAERGEAYNGFPQYEPPSLFSDD